MLKAQALEVLQKAWPMLLIFTVILSSIRIVYLMVNREKFIFYKELFTLIFMLYILILFYVVTYQDPISDTISSYNLMPFKEMFRYDFGTTLFYKNIVGNMLIFVPLGLFISYYLKSKHIGLVFVLSLISSVTIEFAQRLIIGRVFDVDDIILNVLGGMVGYFVYVIMEAIINHMPRLFRKDWFMNLMTIAIIIFIFVYIFDINLGMIKVLP